MPHSHTDLQAVDRRVSEIIGSDRILDSHLRTEKGAIDILVESLQAVDEFAEHWDTKVERIPRFFGRTDAIATTTIDGITVTVSGHDYVSAGAA